MADFLRWHYNINETGCTLLSDFATYVRAVIIVVPSMYVCCAFEGKNIVENDAPSFLFFVSPRIAYHRQYNVQHTDRTLPYKIASGTLYVTNEGYKSYTQV